MKKTNKKLTSMMLVLALMIAMLVPVRVDAANDKSISLSKKNVSLKVGQTTTIKVSTNASNIKWKTSNKKVVGIKVESNKKVKIFAIKAGTAKITCTVNGKKKVCKVTVKKNKSLTNKNILNLMEISLRNRGYITRLELFKQRWNEGAFGQNADYDYLLSLVNNYDNISHTAFYFDTKNASSCLKSLISFYEKHYNDGNNGKDGKWFYFKYVRKTSSGKFMYYCYFG